MTWLGRRFGLTPKLTGLLAIGSSMPFEVTDRNFEFKFPMMTGPDVAGRILVADGAKGPVPATIRVAMQTEGGIQFVDERQPVTPDTDDPSGNSY